MYAGFLLLKNLEVADVLFKMVIDGEPADIFTYI